MNKWKNITLNFVGINLKEATEKLIELDILSLTVRDKREPENSDWFDDGITPLDYNSETHQVSLLIKGKNSTNQLIKKIVEILALDYIPDYYEENFDDQNWVLYTQNKFSKIIISEKMRILPPWESKTYNSGITIIIEPGSGFGVGSHPTTQLCLRWLESNINIGESFLDYGSGSGILSIAAKKLGAEYLTGIDIDSNAINNAEHNCILNKINIPFYKSEKEILDMAFDTVMANILSSTLIRKSSTLMAVTKKRLVLCGILHYQVKEVIEAFSDWIKLKPYTNQQGWVLLYGSL